MNRTVDDLKTSIITECRSSGPVSPTVDTRLDALKKRRSELDAALRAEREKRKEIERKAETRLIRLIGRALLVASSQSPEFKQMITGVLRTTSLSDSDRSFLAARNFL
jgi:hypothetical protein